jgi:hyperosmotically inducible protein
MKALALQAIIAIVLVAAGCSSQAMDDSTITTKVKGKLAADTQTSAIKIGVDTKEGVVTLSGTVPTTTEKGKAEQLARDTEGVKRVVNSITVDPNAIGATNAGEKAGEVAGELKAEASDAAILTSLKAKLIADGIIGTNVDVTNGAVVLKGEVENASEKTKAEQLAKGTAGVKQVTNQLTVKKS